MFAVFKGICVICKLPKWIIVKKGYCRACNELSKPKKVKHPKWDKIFGKDELRNQLQRDNNKGSTGNIQRNDVSQQIQNPKQNSSSLVLQSKNSKEQKVQSRFAGIKKNTPIRKNRKATGERVVFLEIWEERDHTCSCCGKSLGDIPKPIFFSHLLAKSTYPSLRLVKRNIWLKCERCHMDWETTDRTAPRFSAALVEHETLKREYYERARIKRIN